MKAGHFSAKIPGQLSAEINNRLSGERIPPDTQRIEHNQPLKIEFRKECWFDPG
jgi:hypothetical protein